MMAAFHTQAVLFMKDELKVLMGNMFSLTFIHNSMYTGLICSFNTVSTQFLSMGEKRKGW